MTENAAAAEAAVVPPPAPAADGMNSRARRLQQYRARVGGRGRGRGSTAPPSTAPRERTEEKVGIPGIPSFCTPAENGDKARFDKVRSKLASHVVQNLYQGKDLSPILLSLTDAVLAEPIELSTEDEKSKLKVKIWDMEVEQYVLQLAQLKENTVILHTIIWEQCTKSLKIKLKGTDGYEAAKLANDCIWLLTTIRGISLSYESTKPKYLSLDDAQEQYVIFRQDKKSNDDYFKAFIGVVSVYEHLGGVFTHGTAFKVEIAAKVAKAVAEGDDADVAVKKETAVIRDKVLATALIKRSGTKYATLRKDLANAFALGDDKYPCDLTTALGILNAYVGPANERERFDRTDQRTGLQFTQVSNAAPVAGINGRLFSDVNCYACGAMGHYAMDCPRAAGTDAAAAAGTTAAGTAAAAASAAAAATAARGAARQVSFDFSLTQSPRSSLINPNWILLDSESTVCVFCNKDLLTNIGESPDGEVLKVYTNGGSQESKLVGTLEGFGEVWYNPKSLANILSMAAVRRRFRITMDSSVDAAMTIHLPSGKKLRFAEGPSGLYYYNVNNKPALFQNDLCFLNTVEQNKAHFRNREVKGADRARKLSRLLLHPAETQLQDILTNNRITNNPIMLADAKRATYIWGRAVPDLRGRTVRQRPTHKLAHIPVNLPPALYNEYKNVTLNIDFFYVNGIAVLHTISNCLTFRSVDFPDSRSEPQIMKVFNKVKRVYGARGFKIVDLHGDNEFEKIRDDILPTNLTVAAANEHIGTVERSVRTVKESTRAGLHGIPYKQVPIAMVKGLLKYAIMLKNAFPTKAGISNTLSPRNIVQGLPNIDFATLKYEFGEYGELSEDSTVTNTQAGRTKGALALYPRGQHGTWAFLSLSTGREVHGRTFTPLPITDEVIARVTELAAAQGQPVIHDGRLLYEWMPGVPITDDDAELEDYYGDLNYEQEEDAIDPPDINEPVEYIYDSDTEDSEDDDAQNDGDDAQDDGAFMEHDAEAADAPNGEEHESSDEEGASQPEDDFPPFDEGNDDDPPSDGGYDEEEGISYNANDDNADDDDSNDISYDDSQEAEDSSSDDDDSDYEPPPPLRQRDQVVVEDVDEDSDDEEDGNDDDEDTDDGMGRGHRERRHNVRMPHSEFLFLQTPFEDLNDDLHFQFVQEAIKEIKNEGETKLLCQYVTGLVFNQMSAKAGLKKHGERAWKALLEELKQLKDLDVFKAVHASTLTDQQKKEALREITMLKEKRNGILKGRTCADGRSQRGRYPKEQTASPTMSNDSAMLILITAAIEGRDVAIADVAGAYLKAEMNDFVLMKLEGATVDIMIELDPSLKDFVAIENGKRVLYMRLMKALYGCVQSALLWYKLFSSTLVSLGFELNPYDLCVANAIIDGKQCTIGWYVDDNIITHVDPNQVTWVIDKIEEKFGKMVVSRGKSHEFLGMKLDFLEDKTVTVGMKEHIKGAIADFPEDIIRNAATPAAKYLFETSDTDEKLSPELADKFHRIVAKLLYVTQRARVDILLAIAFLCTRVADPDVQDWKKLKRVLQYLRGTLDDVMRLGADSLFEMKTWVDASYAVHPDMKSHTGGCISFGIGVLLAMSAKQKLNVKSSTEAEVVGASDYLPNCIWTRMFMEAQGYKMKESTYYQDNMSAMKLEKNGKMSAGRNSRHIDIRYFFAKDRIDTEGIDIVYCPTEQMLADFFTKPLQGNLFRRLKAVLMGHAHISTLLNIPSASVQERVGSEDFGESLNGHGETKNGPDEDVEHCPTTEKKESLSYADAARGTKRHVSFE